MAPAPDAVVVGAGPAGAVAAMQLARAGARVRLLDRSTFPRDKLCGDTLNPGALALLDRLGPGPRIRQCARPTTGMTVTGPGHAVVAADYPDGLVGLAVRRCLLDSILVEAAVAAGVQFEPAVTVVAAALSHDGARVVGVRIGSGGRERVLPARIVIGADGRASHIGARLKLTRFARSPRRWAYGAYFTDIDGLGARGEMHIRSDGYIGVAPLPGDVANVCVVREHRAKGGASGAPDRVIADAVAADAVLAERFASARRVSPVTVLGPLAIESRAAGVPGLLLAGDAAGFVDPMTGDGLRFAMSGGELAAEAALQELASGIPAHRDLAAARAREFAAKWRLNRALRALVGSPWALQLAAAVTRRWTTPVEYLVAIAGDVPLAKAVAAS